MSFSTSATPDAARAAGVQRRLGPFVRDAAPFRSAHVLLVDQAGRVVAGSGEGDAGRPLEAVAPALAAVQDNSAYIGSGRSRQYVTQSTVEGTTWRLLFAVNTDESSAPCKPAPAGCPGSSSAAPACSAC